MSRKRLWAFVFIYIGAIFLTDPLVPIIKDITSHFQFETGLIIFIIILFLLAVWALCHFVFHIKNTRAYQLLLMISIIYLVSLQDMQDPANRFHLVEYSIFIWLLLNALKADFSGIKLLGFAALILFIVGIADESLQKLVSRRVFEVSDIFENFLGGYLGAAVYLVIQRYRTDNSKPLEAD